MQLTETGKPNVIVTAIVIIGNYQFSWCKKQIHDYNRYIGIRLAKQMYKGRTFKWLRIYSNMYKRQSFNQIEKQITEIMATFYHNL